MIRALALAAVMLTVPAAAQTRPTAVLLDGFAMYQPAPLRPLAELGSKLERQGFRVVHDTHLGLFAAAEEPVVLIGHSAGGATALALAKRQVEQVKYHPTVILLDAAPHWSGVWRCHVARCIAFHTLGYPTIRGARNIPVRIGLFEHARIATDDHVIATILRQTAQLVR